MTPSDNAPSGSKPREFWLADLETYEPIILTNDDVFDDSQRKKLAADSGFIHVIEYSAYQALESKLKTEIEVITLINKNKSERVKALESKVNDLQRKSAELESAWKTTDFININLKADVRELEAELKKIKGEK